MTRRLPWVIVGALLGVTGYRRVSRLARAVRPGAARGAPAARPAGHLAAEAARFARDVRDGMDMYSDRHPGLAGRTLEGQRARGRRPRPAGPPGEGPDRAYPRVDYAKDGR